MGEYYRIITHNSNGFYAEIDGVEVSCFARGRLKKEGLLVGDFVKIEQIDGVSVITDVLPRKNSLIRPSVANVDQIIIVIAPKPQIDFYLLDKLIINCMMQDIECFICYNKTDISVSEFDSVTSQYEGVVSKIFTASAENGDVAELKEILKDKLSCFAGQSAVGKSSLSNAVLGDKNIKTGALSDKIERGKNTTTSSIIYPLESGGYIADTPGFSVVSAHDIDESDLRDFYPDFFAFSDKCKFSVCTHTVEPDCSVKNAVKDGSINRMRYDRYVGIYNELKATNEREFKNGKRGGFNR